MTTKELTSLIRSKKEKIIFAGALVAAFSFFLLPVLQKKYKATSDVLIVQNQEGFTDYYALSKSAEYLSKVLSESIYSERFIEEVKNTNKLSNSFFPQSKTEKLDEWGRIVRVSRNADTGILTVKVQTDFSKDALNLSNAVTEVMSSKYDVFLGNGRNLEVRVLSGPIVEKNISGGTITLVIVGGFLMGAFLMIMFIFYFDTFSKFTRKDSKNDESGPVDSSDSQEKKTESFAHSEVQTEEFFENEIKWRDSVNARLYRLG